jgi:membrane protein implicated in regulation of membrane protease activity
MEAICHWITFPWEQRGIFGAIALAIGFFVFLWRFIDAKPMAFWTGVLAGGGFFLVAIFWSILLAALLAVLFAVAIWAMAVVNQAKQMMSTDRQRDPIGSPATADSDVGHNCTRDDCASCPLARDHRCSRMRTSEA